MLARGLILALNVPFHLQIHPILSWLVTYYHKVMDPLFLSPSSWLLGCQFFLTTLEPTLSLPLHCLAQFFLIPAVITCQSFLPRAHQQPLIHLHGLQDMHGDVSVISRI